MSRNCRACGKFIFSTTPKDLFQDPDSVMLHQIEALTGLFLLGGSEYPTYICATCELALREAIRFRERVILTQKTLQSNPSEVFSLQVFDINEIEGCMVLGVPDEAVDLEIIEDQVVELVEEVPLDDEDQPQEDQAPHDQPQVTSRVTESRADPCDDIHVVAEEEKEVPDKPSTISTSVIFGDNLRKHQRRTDWNKLTEDETVALKRQRRKRDCICEQCGRHFSCPSNFKIHLLRHTGVKSFSCPYCPQKFYTPHLVRRHQVIHTGERPYHCNFCDMSFNNVSGRIQHERIRHTAIKPFKCTECDKCFAVSGKLRTHMLSHTGIRSFHCEACKVSFIRRSHLMAHCRSKAHAQNLSMQEVASKPSDLDVETVLMVDSEIAQIP